MKPTVKIIECPRDAMQGIKMFIPTEKKVQYLQALKQSNKLCTTKKKIKCTFV